MKTSLVSNSLHVCFNKKIKISSSSAPLAAQRLWVRTLSFIVLYSLPTVPDAFKAKVQESGKSYTDIKIETFFAMNGKSTVPPKLSSMTTISKEVPRLVSDQMITIFFQEWAPLFPILHQPSFLELYNKHINSPVSLTSQQFIAQLNLVFGIAAVSAEVQY